MPVPYTREDALVFVTTVVPDGWASGSWAFAVEAADDDGTRGSAAPSSCATRATAGRDRLRLAPVGPGPRDHAPRPVLLLAWGFERAAAADGDLVGERRQLGLAAHGVAAGLQLRRHRAALAAAARRAARRLGRGAARRRRAGPAHRLAAGAAGRGRGRGAAAVPPRGRRPGRAEACQRRADGVLALADAGALHARRRARLPRVPRASSWPPGRRHLGGRRPRRPTSCSARIARSTSSRAGRPRSATGRTRTPGAAA